MRQALAAFKQIGHQRSIGHAVREMGEVMIECGQHAQGVRLLAVAQAIYAAIGVQADERAGREGEAMLDRARAALGHEQVERLCAEGTAMELHTVWESLRLA